MQVEIYTLIDITNTGIRHADGDNKKFQQQANLNTIIQTVSLTTNVYLRKTYSKKIISTHKRLGLNTVINKGIGLLNLKLKSRAVLI